MSKQTREEIFSGVKGEIISRKKIANNTWQYSIMVDNEKEERIRLHNTDIIRRLPNDTIILSSGGWKTSTTKDRINSFLPYKIIQIKGNWYISIEGNRELFYDGITIQRNQIISKNSISLDDVLILKNRIKKYSDDFVNALDKGEISQPSKGDCFYCQFVDSETKQPIKSTDHYLSHFEESYFVPSLLIAAIEFHPVSNAAKSWIGFKLKYHSQECNYYSDIVKKQITCSLIKFLYHQFSI